jgi:gp16 family phage-associated protein
LYTTFNYSKLNYIVTPEDFRISLMNHGLTVRDWARANGFSEMLVYAVLSGKNKASRGESYKIAIAIGLKDKPLDAPNFIRQVIDFKQEALLQKTLKQEATFMT